MWRNVFPKVHEKVSSLIERRRVPEYIQYLCDEGLNWWFNMDTPALLLHLEPLRRVVSEDFPLRVKFLFDATKQEISHEDMEKYFHKFNEIGDYEGASSAAGAGVASVWDSGQEMKRFRVWKKRIEELLEKKSVLSPLSVASLQGFMALMELTGTGNLRRAYDSYLKQREWAEKVGSVPLLIYFAAASAYCLTWMGRFSEAEVTIRDARPLCEMPESNLAVNVYFKIMEGHFKTLTGEIEESERLLRDIVSLPYFESLPKPACLMALGHLLFCLATRGDRKEVEEVADELRKKIIPGGNYFHHAYTLYSLAASYILMGRPKVAYACAVEAEKQAGKSGSDFVIQIPPLVKAQALSDLGLDREVINLLGKWIPRWQKTGFSLMEASAHYELGRVFGREGDYQRGGEALKRAFEIVSLDEFQIPLNRKKGFRDETESLLGWNVSVEVETPLSKFHKAPLKIQTLGGLRLRAGNFELGERNWKGSKSKTLLKAIIVFGGKNVPYSLLQDFLWPESEGDTAENNLKVLISRLRNIGGIGRILKGKWLVVSGKKVTLSESLCAVDSIAFERTMDIVQKGRLDLGHLKGALDLYEGDFIPGEETDSWIIEYRNRLRKKFISGVLLFSTAVLDMGDPGTAVPYLKKALELDFLNEELYARLMEIYLEMGFQGQAAKTYTKAKEVFERELGVSPGTVLKRLAERAGVSDED